MKFVLVSLYNISADSRERYQVFGHVDGSENDLLGQELSRGEALKLAHSYCLPVVIGEGEKVDRLARILAESGASY